MGRGGAAAAGAAARCERRAARRRRLRPAAPGAAAAPLAPRPATLPVGGLSPARLPRRDHRLARAPRLVRALSAAAHGGNRQGARRRGRGVRPAGTGICGASAGLARDGQRPIARVVRDEFGDEPAGGQDLQILPVGPLEGVLHQPGPDAAAAQRRVDPGAHEIDRRRIEQPIGEVRAPPAAIEREPARGLVVHDVGGHGGGLYARAVPIRCKLPPFARQGKTMPQFIYHMKDLRKTTPQGKEILRGIWLGFFHGAKIGVIGANGAGKSSLLRIMAGIDPDFSGEAFLNPGYSVGFLPQEPVLDPGKSVLEHVEDAVAEKRALLRRFDEISARFGEDLSPEEMDRLLAEQARLQDAIDAQNLWDLDRQLEIAMDALRLPPGDADTATLSGGERRRVALCQVLLRQPDLLLLDEPTNHLDAESVAWLERHLQEYPGTVVAITHDRYFLDNVAQWILELDRGAGIPWEGNYTSWLEQKRARLEHEEKEASARRRTLERELEWVRMAPRARHAKGKARLQRYEELLVEDERAERREGQREISIPSGPRLGDLVVESRHLFKGYGDRLLIEDLSFLLPRGGLVGVIGPNGAGKTTLARMMVGQEQPDSGELRVGETVAFAYVDQSRETLAGGNTVWQELSDGGKETILVGKREINSRAYAASFGFRGPDQQKKVKDLSGGERNRLHLAKLLKSGGNVLLLDEPTNDLDVDTLRALEEALLEFAGCALVISHDRWFLDRIATHILAFEGDSKVVFFEGNYQDYEADRRRRLGAEAEQPHRIRYKKLVH